MRPSSSEMFPAILRDGQSNFLIKIQVSRQKKEPNQKRSSHDSMPRAQAEKGSAGESEL